MISITKYFFLSFLLIFSLTLCGGDSDTTSDDDSTDDTSDSINTEKLIGTPFEELTTGDNFDWDYFLCGDYRTETIDEIPIKIFAAFFTEDQEAIIQEGLDIANTAMEDIFYVLTDEWSNDVRVIYKVEDIKNEKRDVDHDAAGHTNVIEFRFDGKQYAATLIPDWGIELLSSSGINKWVVAHELGHASGILGHYLIDYENDTFLPDALEENSLMESSYPSSNPALTDYTYMMQMQGQIILDHLTELGSSGNCN